jgi:hypothetical protein
MSFLKTLAEMFRKKHYTTLDVSSGSIQFLGEPTGEVQVLKDVLRTGLLHDSGLKRAFLARVRYGNDEKIRVALCIDTDSLPRDVIRPLSEHCAQYISSIDIMFFSDLPQHHIDQLKSVVEPFCESPNA